MAEQPGQAAEPMRSRVLRGVAWKGFSVVLLQVSRLAVAVVLARLLTPQEWGLAAMVLVLLGISVLFTDSALGTALIQRQTVSDLDGSTVFWTSVAIGVGLAAVGIALSGTVADFYGEDEVQPLFAVLSLGFVVSSIGMTQAALLVRELDFRSLELRQIGATFAGAAAGIGVALGDYGAWAIVSQQLTAAVVSTALIWRFSRWRPTFAFSSGTLKSLARFTGEVFAQNVLYQVGRALDRLLIGRWLGAASLGAYALATTVILAPFTQVAAPLQQVLFPAFSRMADDHARLAAAWLQVVRLVGSMTIPALIGLIIVAPDFVDVLLGDRWADVAPLIQILGVLGVLQSVHTLNGEVLLALGRSRMLLAVTAIWFVAGTASIVLALVRGWGIVGVAAAYAVAVGVVEPLSTIFTARAVGIAPTRFVRALSGPLTATVVMGLVLVAFRSLEAVEAASPLVRLLLCIVLGIAAYVPIWLGRTPEVRAEVLRLKASRRP